MIIAGIVNSLLPSHAHPLTPDSALLSPHKPLKSNKAANYCCLFYGDRLSDTTCLTQAFFNSGEWCSKLW